MKTLGDNDKWFFKWQTMKEMIINKTVGGDCPSNTNHLKPTLIGVTLVLAGIILILYQFWAQNRQKTHQIRMAREILLNDWLKT